MVSGEGHGMCLYVLWARELGCPMGRSGSYLFSIGAECGVWLRWCLVPEGMFGEGNGEEAAIWSLGLQGLWRRGPECASLQGLWATELGCPVGRPEPYLFPISAGGPYGFSGAGCLRRWLARGQRKRLLPGLWGCL